MAGQGNGNFSQLKLSDSVIAGSLWVLLPRAALSIGLSVVLIIVLFWLQFGELPTFAYAFAGALAVFQILMIYGLRAYKKTLPVSDDTATEVPKRDSADE